MEDEIRKLKADLAKSNADLAKAQADLLKSNARVDSLSRSLQQAVPVGREESHQGRGRGQGRGGRGGFSYQENL